MSNDPDFDAALGDGTLINEIDKLYGKWGAFHREAARLILFVSRLEQVAPELLAVTIMNESVFSFFPEPNTNNKPEDPTEWDYGICQLNYRWLLADINVKYINPGGISVYEVFGEPYTPEGKPSFFTGNPVANARMGARKLLRIGKTDEERAVRYVGPKGREWRLKSYQEFAPRFKSFFDQYGAVWS
jgi:hypothetical protein